LAINIIGLFSLLLMCAINLIRFVAFLIRSVVNLIRFVTFLTGLTADPGSILTDQQGFWA
jgi:hypothetical protein